MGIGLAAALLHPLSAAEKQQFSDETPMQEVGVVIEEVTPESLGAHAGLQAGDLLLSWCRVASSSDSSCLSEGRFESPFDFEEMDIEQAPRGGVRVGGKRTTESTIWVLLPGAQSVEVRPVLPENLYDLYQEGRSLAAANRLDTAVERWHSAALAAKQGGVDRLGIWLLLRAAGALAGARKFPQADELYREAAEQARLMGSEKIDAQIAKAWGKTFEKRGLWKEAERLYRRSLELDRAAGRALAVAWTLHNLGTINAQRGDLQEAESLLQQALAICEQLAPRSSRLAKTLMNLGNVKYLRGDLAAAENHLRHALSILVELAPESLEVANALINLGNVTMARVNLAAAEELYRHAKSIYERIKPESLEMAKALKNLGTAAMFRHDQETADYFTQRALAIEERLDASGAALAVTLENLGLQALKGEDLEKAEEYLHRAMSLEEKLAPNSLTFAIKLQNLGAVAIRKKDCATAENFFQRALTIRQSLKPDSLDVAASLKSLGYLGIKCGDLTRAEDNYRRALVIQERLSPETIGHAMLLHDLGEVYQRQGRSLSAKELFCRAINLSDPSPESFVETDGNEERIFTDCLGALAEVGETAEAFHVLERGRARAFLKQLAERDLLFSSDLPEEMARKRRELDKQFESIQGSLARLSSTREAADAKRLLDRLREIRDQQQELTAQIRKRSPRLASLQYPEPLDLAGARQALDPGTALLAYSIGEDKSYLFVVHPPERPKPGLSVFSIPIGRKALQETVRSFRGLLREARSDPKLVTSQAKKLYALLVAPAEAQIGPAKRLLISADGPLHTLPIAALVRKGRYLTEWKPIHSVLSATVYAELKKARRPSSNVVPSQIVAFGGPVYPKLPKDRDTAPAPTLEILTAVRRGLSLASIPATREEVRNIAALYPGARIFLGAEATEERAKSIGKEARYLHFACHGLLDERFPLNSALALTIPEHPQEGQDNGLLQSWEIFESVRLDADLVTLSACDTALGKEMGGEGLVGLTRAFQYAGARSVLASLWGVADVSTARFMKRFYSHLRAGESKDEALRAAQVDQIRGKSGSSHPFHWAAFELFGDWR